MKIRKKIYPHKHYTEQFAVFLSVLCTIHCILTPILVALLPVAGAYFEQYHWVEYVIFLSVFLLGSSSIYHGYKTHHHNPAPAYIFSAGLLLMLSSVFIKLLGFAHADLWHLFGGLGGILSGTAQLYDLKLSRR